jgi:hypothetical protein
MALISGSCWKYTNHGIHLFVQPRLAFLICLALAGAGYAQPAGPAAALLDRAATKAREAGTIRAEGVTVVEYLSGEPRDPATVHSRILSQDGPRGQARLDITGEHPLVRICGGLVRPIRTNYFGDTHEVVIRGSNQVSPCRSIIGEWPPLPGTLRGVKFDGTKRITIDGKEQECSVLTGKFVVPSQSAVGPRSLCVDPNTGAILWYQSERTVIGETASAPGVRVRETTTFSNIEYGVSLTDADFTFRIPAGASSARSDDERIIWPREYAK